MPLAPGTLLGPYEILAPIGAGGMGEVYKARDTRLDRIVAVKVAHEQFSERFDREARVVASLNHPHICTLHDVGPNYLVMEYLEGQTLAERIAQGPVPFTEAVTLALQMADALDAAHRKGVVHRDVKPGNVMLTKSGTKLLDFGLARIDKLVPQGMETVTMAVTTPGTILGTFQYMAPEQLEGKDADARSDIFSFGAMLYEMVTGQRAFQGKSQVSLMAAILEHDPKPVSSIQPSVPPTFERLAAICLAKNPEDRFQSAREVIRELKWIQTKPPEAAPVAERSVKNNRWALVAAVVFFLAAAGLAMVHFTQRETPQAVVRFSVFPPANAIFAAASPRMALSPDGTQLAFGATLAGKQQIWIRRLDSTEARAVAGTEGAETPFWSPDSSSIAFFADQKLKRVDAAGGPVQILCSGPGNDGGGAWNADGTILFSGRSPDTVVSRVSAQGGVASPVTKLGPQETLHRWPRFLPDGRHFLYYASGKGPENSGVYVASLDGMQPKRVMSSLYMADYANGYLLYRLDEALMARPFDAGKLEFTGEPIQVAPSVGIVPGNGRIGFTVSANGYLALSEGTSGGASTRLAWLDRTGKETGTLGEPGLYFNLQLSPDGKEVAFDRTQQGNRDIWLFDLTRQVPSRMTVHEAIDLMPVWSPDGKTIVFGSARDGRAGIPQLYRKSASGLGDDELLLKSDESLAADDWSADGKFLLYQSGGAGVHDLYVLPMPEGKNPVAVQATPADELEGRFSPNGRWIAFSTNESGKYQIAVRSFPGNERKIQISTEGGTQPQWRRDGKELYFVGGDGRLMAVPVKSFDPFDPGPPVALFQTSVPGGVIAAGVTTSYAVSSDGSKFLFVLPLVASVTSPITVIQNWTAALHPR